LRENTENAHSAEADTIATYEILKAQLDRYPELENDMKSLSEFTTRKKIADFAGMIAFDKDDEEILLWKHKGVKVDKILEQNQVISVGFKWISVVH
jgi:DNA polymerase-3 subunit epsilon